jgi:methylenetetrahydrofolate dehydrogenase (NADP+)/methenyltetrahydrofolate cyclohydrolase
MIIFDGVTAAATKEQQLKTQVAQLQAGGVEITVGAVVFSEDAGSQLYTRLKREAAERVGIRYVPMQFSITDPVETIAAQLQQFNADPAVTGIIIQKPTKKIWLQAWEKATSGFEQGVSTAELNHTLVHESATFAEWWKSLTTQIAPQKDVDGLHPSTLAAIGDGTWIEQGRVLPATCQAVVEILQTAETAQNQPDAISSQKDTVLIIGKSDLLGIPLYDLLKGQGRDVELLTRNDLQSRIESGENLFDGAVIVSATGVPGLITGEMISEGTFLIDVGEPRADIDAQSVSHKAAFLTPVPGGVGPMTVVCLLENAVKLIVNKK